MGLPNPSRITEFSGANGDGKKNPYSADHEQDWQPYPVDPYSVICDDHTYIHHRDNPLLKPTGIQTATKPLPGPTNREHRKPIGVKKMSLSKS